MTASAPDGNIRIFVWVAPAPRSVMPLRNWRAEVVRYVPAGRNTTWPAGQLFIASWIAGCASPVPSSANAVTPLLAAYAGVTVVQMVVLDGIPPGIPGFHTVRRLAGMMSVGATSLTVTVAEACAAEFAMLVATTWYVPSAAGAV